MNALNLLAIVALLILITAAAIRRLRPNDDDPQFGVTHAGDIEFVASRRLEALGVRPGDCLVQIDNVRPKSPEAASAATASCSRVIVSRDGQIIALPPDQWVSPEREDELLKVATDAFLAHPSAFARANPSDGRNSGLSATGITLLPH